MKKTCPVCQQEYTESQKRKTKAGDYRAFRHFDFHGARWCKTEPGKHYAMVITLRPR